MVRKFMLTVVLLIGVPAFGSKGLAQDNEATKILHRAIKAAGGESSLGLPGNICGEFITSNLPPSCVDQQELSTAPIGSELPPVAGDSRPLLDDSRAATNYPVD